MKNHLKNLIKINGTISISQFMNETLFHPQFGYYTQKNPFGKNGDFITAPEISQVFGEIIGAYLVGIWQQNYQNQKVNLIEMGAGKGTLMKDLLNFAKKIPNFLDKFTISIVEISPKLKKIQAENLDGFKINHYDNFIDFYKYHADQPIFFIANELFDCFAIDQLVKTKNGWAEKRVGINNEDLEFVLGQSHKSIKISNAATFKDDATFEYSIQGQNFMDQLTKAIKKTNGIALIIDYGYFKSEFKNTLQAVKNHQFCDILQEAGNCDITSLVDFAALQTIATQNDLQTSFITQREFLLTTGIESRRKKLLENTPTHTQQTINSAIERLIDSKQMGELFKVLIVWAK